MQDARLSKATCANDDEYQVRDGLITFVMNLKGKIYDSNSWNFFVSPYEHAYTYVFHKNTNV